MEIEGSGNELDAGMTGSQDQGESTEAPIETTSQDTTSPQTPTEAPQKQFYQHEIDAIITHNKKQAYEKGKREAMAEMDRLRAQPSNPTQGQSQATDIDALVNERVNQRFDEVVRQNHAAQLERTLTNQMDEARKKYNDFDSVTEHLRASDGKGAATALLLAVEAGIPNIGDIVYEFGKDPVKMASLAQLRQTAPDSFNHQMRALADSIHKNQQALSTAKFAPEPLTTNKPSVIPTGSADGESIDFYSKQYQVLSR